MPENGRWVITGSGEMSSDECMRPVKSSAMPRLHRDARMQRPAQVTWCIKQKAVLEMVVGMGCVALLASVCCVIRLFSRVGGNVSHSFS